MRSAPRRRIRISPVSCDSFKEDLQSTFYRPRQAQRAIIQTRVMHISEFDYELPEELIARYPASPRDSSRMMVLERTGTLVDSMFAELPHYLKPTDVLVINDTRV